MNEGENDKSDHQRVEKDGWTNEQHNIIYQEIRGQLDSQYNFAADREDHAFKLLSLELTLLAVIGTAIGSELITIGFYTVVIGAGFLLISMMAFLFYTGGLPKFIRVRVGGRAAIWIGPDKKEITNLLHYSDGDTTWDEEFLSSMVRGLEDNRRTLRKAARIYALGISSFIFALVVFLLGTV